MKSGCISSELKAAGAIPGQASAGINFPGYSRTGIRKSKTSQWRAGRIDSSEPVHDRAHHPVAVSGQNDFAHRALGNDVHAAERVRERGLHLF